MGTVYFILQKHQMWLRVVTDGPPHHEAWGGVCVVGECILEDDTPHLHHTCVHPSLAYRKNLLWSLKTIERLSTFQSTLLWHQSSHAWQCHGVSGSLARGTHDLSPAASRWFPMVLGYTAGATCAQISSLVAVRAATAACTMCLSWQAPLLSGHLESGLWVRECSTDHCWKSDTPPIHCAKHVQQSINMSIQLPIDLQCDTIQMAEVVQQEYVLISGAWLYPIVNVANTVHLSKHHNYCLQSQNRGHKDRPPEHHLIANDRDKWITNATTPEYAQWTQSLRVLHLFFWQCISTASCAYCKQL